MSAAGREWLRASEDGGVIKGERPRVSVDNRRSCVSLERSLAGERLREGGNRDSEWG
jgi:hypothetical protein